MYENTFELNGLAQAVILVYLHVNPFCVVKLRETSIPIHLQIISAERDKITQSELNFLYVRQVL